MPASAPHHDAAVEGLGLTQAPEPIAVAPVEPGLLLPVLSSYAPEAPGVFLYYPNRRQVLPKLRAFIDNVTAHLPSVPSLRRLRP